MALTVARHLDNRLAKAIGFARQARGVMTVTERGAKTVSQSRPAVPARTSTRDGSIGVLLVNLGSPVRADTGSVRRYLREFLSDPRVIETPKIIWWPILNLIVLARRPARTAHAYQTVWNNERNEAPLITITRSQSDKLGAALAADGVIVDWAMRYSLPTIEERLTGLIEAGCERILIAPLYPQYSASTTATVNDIAFGALQKMRWQPALRTLPAYYDEPTYIAALATTLEAGLAKLPFDPELVLVTYHGLPLSYIAAGDPYQRQCEETTRLLRQRLGWPEDRLMITYQSRFGGAEWTGPYTDAVIPDLARRGTRRIAVVMPGFSSDCLETLEEMAVRNGELFRENGGVDYAAIPCLNDSPEGMLAIETVVRRELSGWL
jgi:ferrochelatase